MKLKTARNAYYGYSGTTSDIARKMSVAGIAIIWLFTVFSEGEIMISRDLMIALIYFVGSLVFDLLQNLIATVFWGLYARKHEKVIVDGAEKIREDEDQIPDPTKKINWATIFCFGVKLVFLGLGYLELVNGLWPIVAFA